MSLTGRTRTALLIVDPQYGVLRPTQSPDAVISAIGRLVRKARSAQTPVIWVQHHDANLEKGSDAWQIVDGLEPRPDEAHIEKSYGDAFEDTSLEAVLARLDVGRLVLAGAQSDACIRCTLHGAFTRGYDVILAADAHAAEDRTAWGGPTAQQVVAHTNLYWSFQAAPGRVASVLPADEIKLD
jgi:nicotinamidase-related amidase